MEYLKYKVLRLCSKKKTDSFAQYLHLIDLGFATFSDDLDIVRLVRRMRMHGTGLYYILDAN